MRSITAELTPELLSHFSDKAKVASGQAFKIETFRELVEKTAQLSYLNKDYLLFYRGQGNDYQNKSGSSTFYPSIYRKDYLQQREISYQFDLLEGACKSLISLFEQESVDGYIDVKKRKYIQWSILQHYGVCDTPLLDFTQSLRVACSFALLNNKKASAYVYVFGMPYVTNRVSINSEHDLVNIRLLSICPPSALRPYFQEGYLVGTPDITNNYDSKNELDFNNRLIAKFEIPNEKEFWGRGFNVIPEESLYPSNDPIENLCNNLRNITDRQLRTGTLGEFLKNWAELEDQIITRAKTFNFRILNFQEAVRILYDQKIIESQQLHTIDMLRKFRNNVVHNPQKVDEFDAQKYLLTLIEFKGQLVL